MPPRQLTRYSRSSVDYILPLQKKPKPTPNKYSMIFARESLHKQKNAQVKTLGGEVR